MNNLLPFIRRPANDDAGQSLRGMGQVESAILRVLAYHDLFRHPLTAPEISHWMDLPDLDPVALAAGLERLVSVGLVQRLDRVEPALDPQWVLPPGPFFALAEITARVARRADAATRAREVMPAALAMGRSLMRIPFVRAVGISGSLSKGVMAPDGDFDYFVIAQPGRLWIARTLIQWKVHHLPNPDLLCANYLVDADTLDLPLRDPFTAVETASMIPVAGAALLDELHRRNKWVASVRPAALLPAPAGATAAIPRPRAEALLAGPWGGLIDRALLAGPWGGLIDRALLHLTRYWVRRKVPSLPALEARGAMQMTRAVAKLHTRDWRNRILRSYQDTLDKLEDEGGMRIDRGLDTSRLLVASAFFYRFDEKQWRAAQPYPPLGTLYAAAVARQAGYNVSLFDAGLAESERGFVDLVDRERPGTVVIYEDGFNYLTKMCLTRMREAALGMVSLARARGAKVLVSSSDAADHADLYLAAGAHAVIKGEGEATLHAVLAALQEGQPLDGIEGIIHAQPGGEGKLATPVATPRRPVLRDLDALPRPAWDLVDMAAYRRIWRQAHGRFSLNISTTRGCPFSCNWCAKPIYGSRYNSRSPESVVDEIADLIAAYQPDHFWITDDIFGLKPGWIQRFAELVRERGLRFSYTIQSRADLLAKGDTLEALAASGLDTVWIGAESGSQRILDAMDKGITRAQIDALVPRIRALGMRSAFFLQFGYPGETRADIDRTIAMVTELLPDQIGISVSYPLPGTVFHERMRAALGEKTNWTHSDDLDLMFPGAYRPNFYRHLHRYVHRRVAWARAVKVLCGALPGGRLRALSVLARQALSLALGALRLRLEKPRGDAPVMAAAETAGAAP
jgi:radical SAM superfamily enzyme YgiQ (UPF0313 family)